PAAAPATDRGDGGKDLGFPIWRYVARSQRLLPFAGFLQSAKDIRLDELFELALHRLRIQLVGRGDEKEGAVLTRFMRAEQKAYLHPSAAKVLDRLLQDCRIRPLKALQVGAKAATDEPSLLLDALQQQGVPLLIRQAERPVKHHWYSNEDRQHHDELRAQ